MMENIFFLDWETEPVLNMDLGTYHDGESAFYIVDSGSVFYRDYVFQGSLNVFPDLVVVFQD